QRAERFDRAPIITAPIDVMRAGLLQLHLNWTPEVQALGCTPGDLHAVVDFISSRLPPRGLVRVFVAADQERSVIHMTCPARGRPLSAAPPPPERGGRGPPPREKKPARGARPPPPPPRPPAPRAGPPRTPHPPARRGSGAPGPPRTASVARSPRRATCPPAP